MINIAVIWGLIILFIMQPGIAHDGAEAGAKLFVHALLPYLLPYIILTQWLLKLPSTTKEIPKWRRFLKAYILGSFGGFPVGAVTVSEMVKNEELSRKQGSILLAACHAPGPMFVIGFVGTELFGDVGSGYKLLAAIHIVNVLFFLIALRFLPTDSEIASPISKPLQKKNGMPFLEAIKESSTVIILVATTVIFFSSLGMVLTSVLSNAFTVDLGIVKTMVLSIFEMTSGVQSATDHFYGQAFFPFLIAAILSMNGLSIHMQVVVIAKTANISMAPYVFGRIWSILLVPLVFYAIY
ncbi:hypothetical protein FITA111629_02835 [Filibacter tadaridae]|uniref:Sporulation integral membrane protein YlbJ n=1 Tax=Filibacter tadaridae TaxID=2483811 RepID=A0A3P5XER9_9BACL|nr:hypothetical protein [Filibacter tadaridae]VDC29861.1 Sporulation integral membrane protein YlbJ [Filibacter tadaridae]